MHKKDIGAALQQLTPELRAVVELTYYNGYLYTEIAEILGCPVGTGQNAYDDGPATIERPPVR